MNGAYVIEIEGETAGIVLVDEGGVQFFAAGPDYWSLDGRSYPSLSAAERAVAALRRERRPPRRPRAVRPAERSAAA